MGVYFDCEICGGQAGEFERVNGKYICGKCQEEAKILGMEILKK